MLEGGREQLAHMVIIEGTVGNDTDKPLSHLIVAAENLPFDQGSVAYGQVVKGDLIEQSGLSAEQRKRNVAVAFKVEADRNRVIQGKLFE